MTPRPIRVAVGALACLILAPAATAQLAGPVCRLPIVDAAILPADGARSGEARQRAGCEAPTARFEVAYSGFPPAAERAFAAAVETWACRIVSAVPIRVDASWAALEPGTLGAAGPSLVRDFPGAPVGNTWYAAALADALAGSEVSPSTDIEAEFNSGASWHLDPDTEPPADTYDLYTVVLHELAHGLGFIGGLRVEDGVGFVGGGGGPSGPFVYDRFTRDRSGAPLLSLPAPSQVLAEALESFVVFAGPAAERAVGEPLLLHAPPRWQPGGSYSHLDERAFGRGTPDGLMSPFIGRGESIDRPGAAVCAVLADLGWPLAGECADAVGPVARPVDGLRLTLTGVNPAVRRLSVDLTSAVPQTVRVTLADALGRRVASLFTGTVGPDAVPVRFDVRGVAPGSYRVIAEGEGAAVAVGVTVVR